MTKAPLILGATLVALSGGIAVFGAQQQHDREAQHHQPATSTHMSPFARHHNACPAGDAATSTSGKSHVPTELAQALDLTTAQQADVDRVHAELCQAMTKAHESVMSVLTPQQRAKLAELHGGTHEASGLHALMKKLHGGGK